MQDFEPSFDDQAHFQVDSVPDPHDEPSTEREHDPSDDGQFSLVAAVRAHRSIFQAPRVRRLFGIPMAGGVSVTTSIAVHVAIIGAGFALYRHFRPPAALNFSLGNASETRNEIFWKEQTPGGAGMPELSESDLERAPVNSAAAVMRQLENNQAPDFPVSNLATRYIGPTLTRDEAPNAGAQDVSAGRILGVVGKRQATAPAANANSGSTTPSATRGDGKGKSIGSGNGNANTGRAGAPTGDPHLIMPGAVYPEESIRRDEEGTVNLSVAVASDGSVREVSVVSAPPFARLTRSAISAVRKQHFDAAYANATITVSYIFTLH